MKLHKVLDVMETQNSTDILAWNKDGRSFTLFQRKTFETYIMKKYFKQSHYKSFQRQMNLYGFKRQAHCGDLEACTYSHAYFRKGHQGLCLLMKRKLSADEKRRRENQELLSPLPIPPRPGMTICNGPQGYLSSKRDPITTKTSSFQSFEMKSTHQHQKGFRDDRTVLSVASSSFAGASAYGGTTGIPKRLDIGHTIQKATFHVFYNGITTPISSFAWNHHQVVSSSDIHYPNNRIINENKMYHDYFDGSIKTNDADDDESIESIETIETIEDVWNLHLNQT